MLSATKPETENEEQATYRFLGAKAFEKGIYKTRRELPAPILALPGTDTSGDRESVSEAGKSAPLPSGLVVRLNGDFAITGDVLQWIVQRRQTSAKKPWTPILFFRSRDALIDYLTRDEVAGELDRGALESVKALPVFHPGSETEPDR
jgi:hypothetical protein